MVGIVTLNPCVDKTVFVNALPLAQMEKVEKVTYLAGGKGNNVARVLKRFGYDALSLNLVAGHSGALICSLLKEEGLHCSFLEVPGESRSITTIVDKHWRQTVLKEDTVLDPSPALDRVLAWVNDQLRDIQLLCICGSVPVPSLSDLPAAMISSAHSRGISVLLDTTGEALKKALTMEPEYCKPNSDEAKELFEGAPVSLLEQLRASGVRHPILSMGDAGALSYDKEELLWIRPPEIETINAVGSGDSFVAGLICALLEKRSWPECLRFATACGSANAATWSVASISPESLPPLLEKVRIERSPTANAQAVEARIRQNLHT